MTRFTVRVTNYGNDPSLTFYLTYYNPTTTKVPIEGRGDLSKPQVFDITPDEVGKSAHFEFYGEGVRLYSAGTPSFPLEGKDKAITYDAASGKISTFPWGIALVALAAIVVATRFKGK